MRIAVVTGASSGIGREFCRQLDKENDFDEMWVVARREDRLASLSKELKCRVRPVSMDLTSTDSFEKYKALLEEYKPDVAVLVNASGFGKFGKYTDVSPEDEANMIDLNCRAVVLMTRATLPYMREGGQIYQLCSVAAFQPIPYINVYGATKAFVLNYSRALNVELRDRKIKCLAVCPFWTKTEFFDRAATQDNKAVTYYSVMFTAEEIVAQALKDMKKKKKDTSLHTFKVKLQIFGVKILPHKLVMRVWMRQQKHL